MTNPLPRFELADPRSPFDEATLVIDGHEEEIITVECPDAEALAARLVQLVNNHAAVAEALTAAVHALRSYEYGNGSTELARSIADHCEQLQKGMAA